MRALPRRSRATSTGPDARGRAARRPRRWNVAVAASAAIFVVVGLVLGIGWLTSHHDGETKFYLPGPVKQVTLQLSSGDAVIVPSGSTAVEVRRTDDYAFGHRARERRSYRDGALTVTSSCPRIVVGSCSASYEVAAPETATVDVRTTDGKVRLDGFRGSANVRTGAGNVVAAAYCGFGLSAVSGSGDLRVAAACAPQHLQLHTGSGDVVALVPPGRYRIEASGGHRRVTGVTSDPSAPFTLDAHSGSGSVTIGGGL
jgi:hypothetical protein